MTTTTTVSTMTTMSPWMLAARGPLLVSAVAVSYFYPSLQYYGMQFWNEYCSMNLLVHLFLGVLGTVWMFHDVYKIAQHTVRTACCTVLSRIVLDDVLKSIYDPETGWIACMTGLVVGASSMYGLKLKPEQRCRLVQSSLRLKHEQEAHEVLMEPGGCKALLPGPVQEWLQPHPTTQLAEREILLQGGVNSKKIASSRRSALKGLPSTPGDISIETNSTYCDGADMMEDDHHDDDLTFDRETVRQARGLSFQYEEEEEETPSKPSASSNTASKATQEANPITVFANILKGIAHEQIKPYAESFPISTVENVGMTTAAALALQLFLRQSSKRHVTVGRLVAAALSGVAAASFGSILTREAVLGHVYDKTSLKVACRDIVLRLADKIKRNVLSNKAKSFLAMAVLLFLGQSPQSTHANRRR